MVFGYFGVFFFFFYFFVVVVVDQCGTVSWSGAENPAGSPRITNAREA